MSAVSQIVPILGGTFEEASHRYVDDNGIDRPSVTQIMDSCGMIDYDNVPGDTMEHKRQIGDAVHYATRLYDQDDLDPFSVHPEAAPYVQCYMNLVEEVGIVCDPEWTEKGFIHTVHGMTYAGTIDRVCRFTKSHIKYRIVLEIKNTYAEEASWKYQTAGYELAIPKEPGEYIARVACQLRPGKKAKLFPYENPRDKDGFLLCLSLVNLKINEGLKWRRS